MSASRRIGEKNRDRQIETVQSAGSVEGAGQQPEVRLHQLCKPRKQAHGDEEIEKDAATLIRRPAGSSTDGLTDATRQPFVTSWREKTRRSAEGRAPPRYPAVFGGQVM